MQCRVHNWGSRIDLILASGLSVGSPPAEQPADAAHAATMAGAGGAAGEAGAGAAVKGGGEEQRWSVHMGSGGSSDGGSSGAAARMHGSRRRDLRAARNVRLRCALPSAHLGAL